MTADSSERDDPWASVLGDAAAVAADYRDDGWTVESVRPRDVAPTTTEGRGGLVVLVPDDEYDRIAAAVDGDPRQTDDPPESVGEADAADSERATDGPGTPNRFDDATVYRRTIGDGIVAIAIERDLESETAVVVPLYYRLREAHEVLVDAHETGELLVHLRPESTDDWVTFAHDEPSLFVPDAWTP